MTSPAKISRLVLALLIGAFVATVVVRTQIFRQRTRSATTVDPTIAKLETVIPEIHFDGVPLRQAVEQLSRTAGIPIRVDWEQLRTLDIHPDAPVRRRLYDLPLLQMLALTFDAASHNRSPACIPLAGEILVTTDPAAEKSGVELRMYDVDDLEERFLSFGPPGQGQYTWTRAERADALVATLREVINLPEWSTFGGFGINIDSTCGRLFILQTPWNHHRIERALYNLRQLQAARDRGDVPDSKPIDLLKEP